MEVAHVEEGREVTQGSKGEGRDVRKIGGKEREGEG